MTKQPIQSLEADLKIPTYKTGPNGPREELFVLHQIQGGLGGLHITSLILGDLGGCVLTSKALRRMMSCMEELVVRLVAIAC